MNDRETVIYLVDGKSLVVDESFDEVNQAIIKG